MRQTAIRFICGSTPTSHRDNSGWTAMKTRAEFAIRSNVSPIQRVGCARMLTCRQYQTRHLCDLTRLVAKQVLSQLSYTPTDNPMMVGAKPIV